MPKKMSLSECFRPVESNFVPSGSLIVSPTREKWPDLCENTSLVFLVERSELRADAPPQGIVCCAFLIINSVQNVCNCC